MKLYNLFEELILEEVERGRFLLESVSEDKVKAAIDGKYNVNILYRDFENAPPSKRYIQVYQYGITKAGNRAIRAYQIFGASKTSNPSDWKIFRLDRIEGWFPTKVKWVKPVSDFDSSIARYNKDGDNSFSQVLSKADITQTPQQIKQTV
jgi:predicted DNA-binding transcriptional regulator YafY